MRRTTSLSTGCVYHLYTKSIYDYVIFPTPREYERMRGLFLFNMYQRGEQKFSDLVDSHTAKTKGLMTAMYKYSQGVKYIDIYAWCLMPTHIHLIARQITENGIYLFMSKTLNSYSQYFNKLHNRKGPLWQERFNARLLIDKNHMEEKINYVHQNPVKDLKLLKPEMWTYSSCREIQGHPTELKITTTPSPEIWTPKKFDDTSKIV